jgi:hypothetical protein
MAVLHSLTICMASTNLHSINTLQTDCNTGKE